MRALRSWHGCRHVPWRHSRTCQAALRAACEVACGICCLAVACLHSSSHCLCTCGHHVSMRPAGARQPCAHDRGGGGVRRRSQGATSSPGQDVGNASGRAPAEGLTLVLARPTQRAAQLVANVPLRPRTSSRRLPAGAGPKLRLWLAWLPRLALALGPAHAGCARAVCCLDCCLGRLAGMPLRCRACRLGLPAAGMGGRLSRPGYLRLGARPQGAAGCRGGLRTLCVRLCCTWAARLYPLRGRACAAWRLDPGAASWTHGVEHPLLGQRRP